MQKEKTVVFQMCCLYLTVFKCVAGTFFAHMPCGIPVNGSRGISDINWDYQQQVLPQSQKCLQAELFIFSSVCEMAAIHCGGT